MQPHPTSFTGTEMQLLPLIALLTHIAALPFSVSNLNTAKTLFGPLSLPGARARPLPRAIRLRVNSSPDPNFGRDVLTKNYASITQSKKVLPFPVIRPFSPNGLGLHQDLKINDNHHQPSAISKTYNWDGFRKSPNGIVGRVLGHMQESHEWWGKAFKFIFSFVGHMNP